MQFCNSSAPNRCSPDVSVAGLSYESSAHDPSGSSRPASSASNDTCPEEEDNDMITLYLADLDFLSFLATPDVILDFSPWEAADIIIGSYNPAVKYEYHQHRQAASPAQKRLYRHPDEVAISHKPFGIAILRTEVVALHVALKSMDIHVVLPDSSALFAFQFHEETLRFKDLLCAMVQAGTSSVRYFRPTSALEPILTPLLSACSPSSPHAYSHAHAHARTHRHTLTHALTRMSHARAHAYAPVHALTPCTRSRARSHVRAHAHAPVQALTRTLLRVRSLARSRVRADAHTPMQALTRTLLCTRSHARFRARAHAHASVVWKS